ncbi:hypothetical protein ES703_117532 [subsurface metagenome]
MRRIVIRYVQYGEIHAVLFFGRLISRPQRPLLPPLPHGSVGTMRVAHPLKALFRDMLCYSGYEFLCWKQFKVFLVLAVGHGKTVQHLACVLDIGNLLLGKGVAHDILSQRFLTDLVIPGDAVPCINAESVRTEAYPLYFILKY